MTSGKENEESAATVDPARDFLDFWKNYFEQTAIQTRILLESVQGGKALDQMHGRWLDALSESLESFMRTPAFLEVLRQNLKRMIDLKLLQDQMTQAAARQGGIPVAGDISGLFERVNSAEQTILMRLNALEDRLKVMELKLHAGPAPRLRHPRRKRASSTGRQGNATGAPP